MLLGFFDEGERVLDAGVVGLGGESEEPLFGFRCGEILMESVLIDAEVGAGEWGVSDLCALLASVFANAVDGVVVVAGGEELGAGFEGEGFADELEGTGGILGEDEVVVVLGVEVGQSFLAGGFDQACHGERGGVGGVRVAEDVGAEEVEVFFDL